MPGPIHPKGSALITKGNASEGHQLMRHVGGLVTDNDMMPLGYRYTRKSVVEWQLIATREKPLLKEGCMFAAKAIAVKAPPT